MSAWSLLISIMSSKTVKMLSNILFRIKNCKNKTMSFLLILYKLPSKKSILTRKYLY